MNLAGLFLCLCAFGLIAAAMSVVGSLFRRNRHRGGWGRHHGHHGGYGYGGGGWGGGIGSLLGGLGLGWMLGNAFDSFSPDNIIDGEAVEGFDTVDNQLDDNGWSEGGGWDGDSGGWGGDGGDWGGGGDSGGWTDA